MIDEIMRLLVGTAAGFLTTAVLLRFLMQASRVSFRNPLGQFVFAVTDWAVKPLRRFVPAAWGYDSASLLVALLCQWLKLLVLLVVGGIALGAMAPMGVTFLLAVFATVELFAYLVIGIVLISAIFSWVNPHAPLADLFDALARPWLRPFRRWIPPMGGVDLSPLALIVLIQVTLIVLGGMQGSLLRALYF